jgi:thiamine pyrophosphate-dependent acetolactate synthase large subunit-like protein
MQPVKALKVLLRAIQDDWIVVTNQGSARIWPKLVERPLDLHYNPSTMGGAVPLAIGLALAQPEREVICVTGDGALLMNLGSLVTAVACQASNLTIVVLNNGLYEVTGGQRTPGHFSKVDFCGLAVSAGDIFHYDIHDLQSWEEEVHEVLGKSVSPRFVTLHVEPTPREYLKHPTPPMAEQLARFLTALNS